MARICQAALAAAVVLVLSGCGMNGKWTLESIDPESARGHFKLATVELKSDGTYVADSDYDGKTQTSTGKYTYDKETKKLTFTPDQGEARTYDAELVQMCSKMRVKTASEHGDVVAIMKRK
jgi:hypothetical protein